MRRLVSLRLPALVHRTRVSLIASLAALVVAQGAAAEASPNAPVTECVAFTTVEAADDALVYDLANDCETRVRCRVTWNIVCGEDRKGPTHAGSRALVVAPAHTARLAIPASACGDDAFSIEDVAWSCSPA